MPQLEPLVWAQSGGVLPVVEKPEQRVVLDWQAEVRNTVQEAGVEEVVVRPHPNSPEPQEARVTVSPQEVAAVQVAQEVTQDLHLPRVQVP